MVGFRRLCFPPNLFQNNVDVQLTDHPPPPSVRRCVLCMEVGVLAYGTISGTTCGNASVLVSHPQHRCKNPDLRLIMAK